MRNRRLRRGVITTAIVALAGGIGIVGVQAATADDAPKATQTEQDSTTQPESRASTGVTAGAPLSAIIHQIDGTAPFDKNDEAGYDSSDKNGLIRTNDTITFRVEVRSEGTAKQNTIIRIPMQAGLEAQKLPPYCQAGSATTPESLPEPGSAELPIPITKDSWKSLPAQEITCNVGTLQPAATFLYGFTAKVRSEVPNGTVIKTKAFVKADGQAEIATGEASVKISARAKFNVTTNSWQSTENTGYFYSEFRACSFDTSRQCSMFNMPIMVTVPSQGGRGTSPAQSPMTFDYDLSPESYFYEGVTKSAEWKAAGAGAMELYAPRIVGCSSANGGWWHHPGGKMNGAATAETSVRNTGAVACNQPKLGEPMNFTLTGADTTAYTTPTKTVNPKNMAIPADRAYVASIIATIEVPNAAIVDLGNGEPSRRAMEIDGHIRNFNPVGIDGVANDPNADAAFDNHRKINRVVTFGDGFAKYYSGIPNDPNNVPASQYKAGWATHPGVAGSSSVWAGDGIVLPGQRALSTVQFSSATPAGGATSSRLACDTWDNDMMSLAAGDYAKDPGALGYTFPSNGKAAWVSAYWTRAGGYATDPAAANVSIEYGSGPIGVGDESRCGDADSVTGWVTDPAAVPGNDPELAAKGIYTAVNKVRIYAQMTPRVDGRQDLWVAIALEARANPLDGGDDFEVGTPIPNYAAILGENGDLSKDELLASNNAKWTLSTYKKEDASGSNGDRLLVGTAIARIAKEVTDPKTGAWTAATPAFQAGDEISYRLTPSLTAGASSIIKPEVAVEDCLPADLVFLESTPAASIASRERQDKSELKCQDGETYLKWELGPQEINGAIEPIVYKTRVASTSSNGSKVNTTAVSAENELSKLARRTAINTVIINSPAGVKLEKQAMEPVVEINRADGAIKRDMKWQVAVVNVGDMPNISDIDVIDVLPRTGVNESKFTGSLELKDIKTVKGKNVALAYTADPAINQDPTNTRNSASGATTWCDALSNGKVVSGSGAKSACPKNAQSATGMRIMRAGAFAPADAITVEVTMTADANAAADVYVNRAMAQAKGLTLPFGPINAPIRSVESSIGDYVWQDENSDGLQNEGEVGIANVPVTLTGTDSVGNKVSLGTKTDADGKYGFSKLTAGDYTLHFEAQDRDFTVASVGADSGIDSDVDAAGNVSFTLAQGKDDLTLDAGILPIPSAKVSKSVINLTHPGEKARPGDVLRYLIVGENPSTGTFTDARPAVIVDDMTEVLDDADLNGDPLYALTGDTHPEPVNAEDPTNPVDPDAVIGTLTYTEPELTWTGPLRSGDKVTISYEVTVKAQDDLGDRTAVNVARLGEGVPPTGTGPCTQEEIDAGLCDSTVTPMGIGDLDVRKLVETKPGSGSFIEADDTDGLFGEYVVGDTITWQIKVTNTGEYPLADIAVTDPLVPSCNKVIALLEPGHDAVYECTSKAEAGMTNVVTASAEGPDGKKFVVTDPASVKVGPAPIVPKKDVAITGSNVLLMGGLSVLIVGLGAALLVLRRRGQSAS